MKFIILTLLLIYNLFGQDQQKKHIYIEISRKNTNYIYEPNQECKMITGGKYDITFDYHCYEFTPKRSGYVEIHTNFWLNCDTKLYAENGKLLDQFWAGRSKLHKYVKRGKYYKVIIIPKNEKREWISINLP